jgi:hypothetical protein
MSTRRPLHPARAPGATKDPRALRRHRRPAPLPRATQPPPNCDRSGRIRTQASLHARVACLRRASRGSLRRSRRLRRRSAWGARPRLARWPPPAGPARTGHALRTVQGAAPHRVAMHSTDPRTVRRACARPGRQRDRALRQPARRPAAASRDDRRPARPHALRVHRWPALRMRERRRRGLRRDGCARDASHSTRHRRHGGPCVQASPRATRAARRGSVAPRHVHQENASSRQGIPSPFPAPRSATERSPPRPRPVLRAGTRGRRLPRQSRHARRRASTRLHRARRPADQAIAVRLLRRARGVRPPHHPPQATHGRDVASRPDHWAGRPAAPALRGLHPGDAMVPDCPRHRLPRHRRPSAGLPRSHRGTDRGGVR